MHEIEAQGFTRDMVYGAVKRGELVNQNRKDAWGRTRRGAGLFTVAAPAATMMRHWWTHGGDLRGPAGRYNCRAAWSLSSCQKPYGPLTGPFFLAFDHVAQI
jgi:hypothetical protein